MGKRPDGKGPRDRINHLQVVVDADERAEIKRRAAAAGLSVSAYLRAVALGRQISPVVDQPGRGAPEIEVRRLLDRLGDLQGTLADIVARV